MNFSDEFLSNLKIKVKVSDIVGKYVSLKRKGKEYSALSPFTNEKTASFFVNNEKGFYHCFSSGKHGDIIDFLIEVEGVNFVKAVEIICDIANIPVEREGEINVNRVSYKKELECMKKASEYFSENLMSDKGTDARKYLRDRKINLSAVKYFQIGYSEDSFDSLMKFLKSKGFENDTILKCGLIATSEDGSKSWDRFRGRIMFPIKDDIGRVVAFGGRSITSEKTAKYLNSPETELFKKRKMLYNITSARKAIKKKGALNKNIIVCEGYMDVIALHMNGIESAVAPMGTALTDLQLEKIWSYDSEPVICFDGDKSGISSSEKIIDNFIKKISPNKTMGFIFLEDELDPDDYIKKKGKDAFLNKINNSLSFFDVLWNKERLISDLKTPERIAGFKDRVFSLIKQIEHSGTSYAFKKEAINRFSNEFPYNSKSSKIKEKASSLGTSKNFIESSEFNLIGSLLFFPELIEGYWEEIQNINLSNETVKNIRSAILQCYNDRADHENFFNCVRKNLSESDINEVIKRRSFICASLGGLHNKDIVKIKETWIFNLNIFNRALR